MEERDLKRLVKIENEIQKIVFDELGLTCYPIEFDVVPAQKMLEIMAYHLPTNISNWKYGREYEKHKTIYDHYGKSLPYEVITNSKPARAYLMKENRFATQVLVMAHCYGHCVFFSNNKYFVNSHQDIVEILLRASERIKQYERKFGIEEVEKTIDAGHALQLHSSPFESGETEDEKRKRIFEQTKKQLYTHGGRYSDLLPKKREETKESIELYNQRLWRKLKLTTPVEPTEDLLRYIIDNSKVLEDWQKDILEILRIEGQYYWPIIRTKFMNEGFATIIHEKVMKRLFERDLLTSQEHADFNYANSLVKAKRNIGLNPYLVGSAIWYDIEKRWDKGQFGDEWERCKDRKQRKNWDTKLMKGWEKCKQVLSTYIDWFFMQEFLTLELIDDLQIYNYEKVENFYTYDYVISDHTAKEVKDRIVRYFSSEITPKIVVSDGNYMGKGRLRLLHKYTGVPLDKEYGQKTLKHIAYLWGEEVSLVTQDGDNMLIWEASP